MHAAEFLEAPTQTRLKLALEGQQRPGAITPAGRARLRGAARVGK
jgi:hypothetical protein